MELFEINEKGSWITENPNHAYDKKLSERLIQLLKNKSVFDFGCGDASYLKNLKYTCTKVNGCDGNPFTKKLTDGIGFTADLSILQNFGLYDWVISFEVGEHIPKEYENIFIDNLCNHAKNGIIMSWAFPNQPGEGHINCQSSEYLIDEFYKRNFLIDFKESNFLREISETWWFKSNLLVFYKISK